MDELRDFFCVRRDVIETRSGPYYFVGFMGMLGVSGKCFQWAKERVEPVTEEGLECLLIQAQWDWS